MGCNQSGNCCQGFNVVLSPQDLQELASGLDCTVKQLFKEQVVTYKIETASGWMQPILNNRTSSERKCPFLTWKQQKAVCKVYEHRPVVCQMFPRSLNESGEVVYPEKNKERCPGCTGFEKTLDPALKNRLAEFLSHKKLVNELVKSGLNLFEIKGNKKLQTKFFRMQEQLYEEMD